MFSVYFAFTFSNVENMKMMCIIFGWNFFHGLRCNTSGICNRRKVGKKNNFVGLKKFFLFVYLVDMSCGYFLFYTNCMNSGGWLTSNGLWSSSGNDMLLNACHGLLYWWTSNACPFINVFDSIGECAIILIPVS